MTSPTCGARRIRVYSASGMPRKFCRPLSAPPMRVPRPPARIRPVMASLWIMAAMLPPAAARTGRDLSADVAHFDAAPAAAGIGGHGAAQLGIAVGAALPDLADRGGQLLVGGAAAQ